MRFPSVEPPKARAFWARPPHLAHAPEQPPKRHARFDDFADFKIRAQAPLHRTFAQELEIGLRNYAPKPTKTGVNGSFFLCDSLGKRIAIFKPMNMEAGGRKNHRLDAAHNVQFRNSILPGQGAGNEVLAYALDHQALGGRYEIPKTILVCLSHAAFEGQELGSAQQFISNARALSELSPEERARIPETEWAKLNFRLISGSTDAHLGNILYCDATQKLYLIDSGDDFVGEDGECQYYNPWTVEPRCNTPLSTSESSFLEHLDAGKIMQVFEQQALANEQAHPKLKVSVDKYLTQIIRLMLAKTAGHYQLSPAEWSGIMSSHRGPDRHIHRGDLEHIYDQYCRPYSKLYSTWKEASQVILWDPIQQELNNAARAQLEKRRF